MKSENSRRNFIFSKLGNIGKIAAASAAATLFSNVPAKAMFPACFLKGTKIRTTDGEKTVEDLRAGDMLPTMFGGERPIQWIAEWQYEDDGSRRLSRKYHQIIRIAPSALAPNVPGKDLFVTQGHAILVEDVLIPAGALVNGTTIKRVSADDLPDFHVFNIKLATHDVIFAHGAPCETMLEVDETAKNFDEYRRLFGQNSPEATYCAPVFCNGGLAEIRSEFASLMSPWFGPHKVDLVRERLDARARVLA